MGDRRILVLGSDGQVGWELQRTLLPIGSVAARNRAELDLSDPDAVRLALCDLQPDVIVNAAAYTAVDRAEAEPEQAFRINGEVPGLLAEEAKRSGALLVHYSTDYVYDGSKGTAYVESDPPGPINVYGSSKLAGDQAIQDVGGDHLILRTSWVYGMRGRNFLRTILRLAAEKEELRIVDDQVGCPTWSRWIAEITAQVIGQVTGGARKKQYTGIYHLCGGGSTTWHGFASAIVDEASRLAGLDLRVRQVTPIPTSAYPTPARRPPQTPLSCKRLQETFRLGVTGWEEQLRLCLADPGMHRILRTPTD
ncbi:MAG TPA: dTDP-4-dehydrorhamnose reductase [Rhodothermales bacterium]|nr:dTDP-4-dehydrorhamnose reductase [Rhodothermales bacterium]